MIDEKPELNLKTVVYASDLSLCSKNNVFHPQAVRNHLHVRLVGELTAESCRSLAAIKLPPNQCAVELNEGECLTLLRVHQVELGRIKV